ncbi:MAG: hypothetical protein ACREUT_20970 [Steroidobacteraceae bacterium]
MRYKIRYNCWTPDGIRLTPFDPDFAKAIESTRHYMRRHRNAMNDLAKR